MVQNVPPNALYGYPSNNTTNYGLFNNGGMNDDFMYNATFRNFNQAPQTDVYTPQFTGVQTEGVVQEEEPKKKGIFGKILGGIALIGGAILLKKNWSSVSKWAKGLFKGGKKAATNAVTTTSSKAQQTIQRNANKVQGPKKAPRKHRLEHTVPNRNPKPITNAREAQVVENINLSHVNANTRKMVEKAGAGTVTPAQQAAYDRAIAYQAPTAAQKTAIAELHSANAAERAVKNSIGNRNCYGAGNLRLVEASAQAEAKAAKIVANRAYRHPGTGNIYHVQNGAITRVELYQRNKAGEFVKNSVELTDPAKISKHLAKQEVSLTDAYFREVIS